VQDAVVRNIEIIGEAANQIARMSPDFISQHPELPWWKMRNMRMCQPHPLSPASEGQRSANI